MTPKEDPEAKICQVIKSRYDLNTKQGHFLKSSTYKNAQLFTHTKKFNNEC